MMLLDRSLSTFSYLRRGVMVADVALPWVWREEEPPSHPVGEEGQRGTPTLSLTRPQVEQNAL